MFEFQGIGLLALWMAIGGTTVGLAAAVQGFWRNVPRARRLAVVCAGLPVSIGAAAGAILSLAMQEQLQLLGPALTSADLAHASQIALSPFVAGLAGSLLVALVAGSGWALVRAPTVGAADAPRRG